MSTLDIPYLLEELAVIPPHPTAANDFIRRRDVLELIGKSMTLAITKEEIARRTNENN